MSDLKLVTENDITSLEATTDNQITITGDMTVTTVLDAVKNIPAIKPDDMKFLVDHQKHLGLVLEKTYQWRTNSQKRSIVNDFQHPTLHGKFHQAILEQKVQFDQGMYLAKEYQMKQLDIREKQLEINDLIVKMTNGEGNEKDQINLERLNLELNFMNYELEQMYISMSYRMEEVKGWQPIIDKCYEGMRANGMEDDQIWSRDEGEIEELFMSYTRKILEVPNTTDPAAADNIKSLAVFAYKEAKDMGIIDRCVAKFDSQQMTGYQFIIRIMQASGMQV